MPETLNLNYYYGNEADQYSFYRIPKILLTDRRYSVSISTLALSTAKSPLERSAPPSTASMKNRT